MKTSRSPFWIVVVAGATLVFGPATARATTYVFNTSDAPLSAELTALLPAGFIEITPANAGTRTINGTALSFKGYEGVPDTTGLQQAGVQTASFFVRGDLTLNDGDVLYGFGPNLLSIEVGNNARLEQGSRIDVSGVGRFGGAGAGDGGVAQAHPALEIAQAFVTQNVGLGGGTAGNPNTDGTNGGMGTLAPYGYQVGSQFVGYDPRVAASTLTGGAGGPGMNDWHTTSGLGGAGVAFTGPLPQGTGGGGGTGAPGTGSFPVSGFDGGNGQAGADGIVGRDGDSGAVPTLTDPTRTRGPLRGGSGGGAGAAAAYGLGGARGGAGGGGGTGNFFGVVAVGGDGGQGGRPGGFGVGGAAGDGGGGGGGLQLVVRGQLYRAGDLAAAGTGGSTGTSGQEPAFGPGVGAPGTVGGGLPGFGGAGGNGGTGGVGGFGRRGGEGGDGAAGSGGSIHVISAMHILDTFANPALNVDGGALGTVRSTSFGGNVFTDTTPFGTPRASNGNPYRSYQIPSVIVLGGGLPISHTPNIPSLVGGADTYGLIGDAAGLPSQNFAHLIVNGPTAPPLGARAAVKRVDRLGNASYGGYDMLTYSSLGGAVADPRVVAINAGDATHPQGIVPAGLQPLLTGGFANDPTATPGATGPLTLPTLGALHTFATVVEDRAFGVTASFTPYALPRRFRADLVADGAPLWLIDRGLLQVDVLLDQAGNPGLPLLQAIGDSVNLTVSGALQIRAGTNQQVDFRASNIGAAGSFLSGTYNAGVIDRPFTNLAAGQPSFQSINFLAENLARGSAFADVNINYTLPLDDFGPYVTRLELEVPVVGPLYEALTSLTAPTVFNATPGTGDAVPFTLTIRNADNTIVPYSEFTDLSLLTFSFEHDQPGAAFTFNPVYLLFGNPDFLLSSQETEDIGLLFNPSAPGEYHSRLTIVTDANAEFGTAGDTYTVELYGAAVPEPTSVVLLGLGGLALLGRRRR